MKLLETLWHLGWAGCYFMDASITMGMYWQIAVMLWLVYFAGNGKKSAPYALWYDNEVRPYMDNDPRMNSLTELEHARLRWQTIRRVRTGMISNLIGGHN